MRPGWVSAYTTDVTWGAAYNACPMNDTDNSAELAQQIKAASESSSPLCIHGGASKNFYGREPVGERLDVSSHQGVISYDPTELVIRVRAGTPLAEVEQLLAENAQMLTFEPPSFGGDATIGGAIAAGLAGPRRPWGGAPRDVLLGVTLLDGLGRQLSFGGQVMKNVAGYDAARLMAGALGTLGVLLDVSLKVLPKPLVEVTRVLELTDAEALGMMRRLAQQPLPLSGACVLDGRLYLRLSGNESGVAAWLDEIGGDEIGNDFWVDLNDQRLPFFADERPLWRLSLPPATPPMACEDTSLIDWAGAQRWVYSDHAAQAIREQVAVHEGHAMQFKGGDRQAEIFHPLDTVKRRLHQGLKEAFDPKGVLNPGRLYPGF